MNKADEQYLALQKRVLEEGVFVGDRTGTGCYRVFGAMMRFNLSEGTPLYTTKKIFWKNPIGELLWMLNGNTDLVSLRKYQNKEDGAHTIWSDDFEKFWNYRPENNYYRRIECGGEIYGKQLRDYNGYGNGSVDQLVELIKNIKATVKNPNNSMGRRLKCEFWNPFDHLLNEKENCALPACHTGFQCMVDGDKLNLKFEMRSNDLFLGNPYNVFFYGVLCEILARLTGLKAGELIYFGTDVHIYSNHIDQVKEQQTREPRKLPTLVLPEFETLEELLELTAQDFDVVGYDPHPFIKAPQAS